MIPARTRLNERAQRNWGDRHNEVLTRDFKQTVVIEHDQRWVCIIKINGVEVARSVEHRNKKAADEEASLCALGWMNENSLRG
jgi:Double-stranded RNA binding motif